MKGKKEEREMGERKKRKNFDASNSESSFASAFRSSLALSTSCSALILISMGQLQIPLLGSFWDESSFEDEGALTQSN